MIDACPAGAQGRGRVRSAQAGQSMVEFALVGPLFFLAVFAVLEAALFVNARVSVDNASREGARLAALCGDATVYMYNSHTYQAVKGVWQGVNQPPTNADGCYAPVLDAVDSHLGFLNVIPGTNPKVGVSCPSDKCPAGTTITVSVQYTYQFLIPFLLDLSPGTVVMTSTVQAVSQQ